MTVTADTVRTEVSAWLAANHDPTLRRSEWLARVVAQGTSSSVVSLGKLAMSRILHTAGSLQEEILGAEGLLAGTDSTRAADATYSLLNAFFTSIGGGTDQIQRNIIGERILGLPKEPELDKTMPFREVPKPDIRT